MRSISRSHLLQAISLLNLIFLLYALVRWGYKTTGSPPTEENDYPIELPQHFDTVAMTLLRDTSHFQMDLEDHASRLEWSTLSTHPFVVYVGSNERAFQTALFHQLHCIHVMEEAFLRGEYMGLNPHHIQHCLNYLRQSFLCIADDSLEGGDFLTMSDYPDRNAGDKVCRDWMGVSAAVRGNLKEWLSLNSSRSN